MADSTDELPEETPGYKPPAQVSLEHMKNLDANDESLNKWKEQLLKGAASSGDPADPRKVIVQSLSLVVADREDVLLDLTGADLSKLKDSPFSIKEGCEYRLRIKFKVQHDVVAGLKYLMVVYRKGVRVDKSEYMVGSYGPQAEPHVYTSPIEEAPSGMLARGHYTVKSKFIDDDKKVHLEWEWSFDIKKEF
eukprot:Colp12_sorted_trinity150504_noHs@1115